MDTRTFKAKNGSTVNGINHKDWQNMLKSLQEKFFLQPLQTAEAAAFSMAMVVRYALGLDASGGQILGLTRSCLSGAIAAATLRHLVNGGASAMIGIEAEPNAEAIKDDALASAYLSELEALNALGVPIFIYTQVEREELENGINNSHNVIVGLYDEKSDNHCKDLWPIIDCLNESATPIHTIISPLEIDSDTGRAHKNPLYASSTLSLGAPLSGLHSAQDFIGRHYVCDISLPKDLRNEFSLDAENLFSEQPVVQLEAI